jgi:hypothetical protein
MALANRSRGVAFRIKTEIRSRLRTHSDATSRISWASSRSKEPPASVVTGSEGIVLFSRFPETISETSTSSEAFSDANGRTSSYGLLTHPPSPQASPVPARVVRQQRQGVTLAKTWIQVRFVIWGKVVSRRLLEMGANRSLFDHRPPAPT